jgi:hypothetical protein
VTFGTFSYAVRAGDLPAVRTLLRAVPANCLVAATTAGSAFLAKTLVAKTAIAAIVAVYDIPTVIAGFTIPRIQRHIWAVRAVGIKDAPYQREEIT